MQSLPTMLNLVCVCSGIKMQQSFCGIGLLCRLLLTPVGLSLKRGLMDLVSIFVSVHACVRNHISDVYRSILFVLGTETAHDGIHMHVNVFCDQIQDGRLVAILVIFKT